MDTTDKVFQNTFEFLMQLIRFPSTRGKEGEVAKYICQSISPYVDEVELVPVKDAIINDPEYAFYIPNFTYKNMFNVRCRIKGSEKAKKIVFNAHMDVVPPNEGMQDAFNPRYENGIIYGRGACDDKGPLSAIFAMAVSIHEKGQKPKNNLEFHFVFEEENGGNGTLALVRQGVQADAVVVMETCEMELRAAVRGAIWFQLEVYGLAGHSGSQEKRISALDQAFEAMGILKDYHDKILSESKNLPLFDQFKDPMPLTVGLCEAGTWPASIPAKAVLKGVLGFLPNKSRQEIQNGMCRALEENGNLWLREHFNLTFPMLRNEGNQLPQDHPLVTSFARSMESCGVLPKVSAMTAACDAWKYDKLSGIPAIVFGPGQIKFAHSAEEQIKFEDVMIAARVIEDFSNTF